MKKNNSKSRKVLIKPFKMVSDSFDRGLVVKRDVNLREARYIMKHLLGIEIYEKEETDDLEEYNSYNEDLLQTVNEWIKGEVTDENIMEYASDCSDEPLGIWNAFKIVQYLQRKEII